MIQLDPGPGGGRYQSSRFLAGVNGEDAYVYGHTEAATMRTVVWDRGDAVEVSWLCIGADENCAIAIGLIDVDITEAVVYPVVPWTIVNGQLLITAEPNTRLWVAANADKANTLIVHVKPPSIAPDVANRIDFTTLPLGTTEWTDPDKALYFPAGIHNTGIGFRLGPGACVYRDAGAVIEGNWDIREWTHGWIMGPGSNAGVYATYDDARKLGGDDFQRLVMYRGSWGVVDTIIDGGVDFAYPVWCDNDNGTNRRRNSTIISPWHQLSDGPEMPGRPNRETPPYITGCAVFVGDDGVGIEHSADEREVSDMLVITTANCPLNGGYWPGKDGRGDVGRTTIRNCDLMMLGVGDTPGYEGHPKENTRCLIRQIVDASDMDAMLGHSHYLLEDIRVWGEIAGRLIVLGPSRYPYEAARQFDQQGHVAHWTVRGLWTEQMPQQMSRLLGQSDLSCAHDIAFEGLEIAGQAVGAANHGDFFEVAEVCHGITWGDEPSDKLRLEAFDIILDALAVSMLNSAGQA